MFIGELRIGKHQIRSRILAHLIVDRVSRNLRKAGPKRPPGGEPLYRMFQPAAHISPYHAMPLENRRTGGSRELPSAMFFTRRPIRLGRKNEP
jgi:hypothetical protein